MRDLCEEKTIDSMVRYEDKVIVFRREKYWIFQYNSDNEEKPLGPLIKGDVDIGSKWEGIDGSKTKFTIRDNKLVAIDANKWTETDGEVTKEEEILSGNRWSGNLPSSKYLEFTLDHFS